MATTNLDVRALVGDHRHGRATDIAGANAGNLLDCAQRAAWLGGRAVSPLFGSAASRCARARGRGGAGLPEGAPGLKAISSSFRGEERWSVARGCCFSAAAPAATRAFRQFPESPAAPDGPRPLTDDTDVRTQSRKRERAREDPGRADDRTQNAPGSWSAPPRGSCTVLAVPCVDARGGPKSRIKR